MLELVLTTFAVGTTKFIGDLALGNVAMGGLDFGVGNVKGSVDYSANLDLARRNFHMTIDIDINF